MNRLHIEDAPSHTDIDWVPFPGGELEGSRSRPRCSACRDQAVRADVGEVPTGRPALCFQCYRLELERNRRIRAAGEIDTASEARFQTALPFEPVNTARLAQLKAERQQAQAHTRAGAGSYVERRRRAQIEARHALSRIFQGLKQRRLADPAPGRSGAAAMFDAVTRAAELQLPESWLPFVVSR